MVSDNDALGGKRTRIEDSEGEVKWFDPRKGFGFIVGPEGQDIFAHYSVIDGDGFRVLRDGARVRYSAERTDKGWKATKVSRLAESDVEVVVARRNLARTPRQ
ncbi:MAG: cold shock domain-containing protein [Planctomycetota bacterium]